MRLGSEDRVDVGLTESSVVHALEEETDGRGVGDIRGRPGANTASEEAVDDDRTRVQTLSENCGEEHRIWS